MTNEISDDDPRLDGLGQGVMRDMLKKKFSEQDSPSPVSEPDEDE